MAVQAGAAQQQRPAPAAAPPVQTVPAPPAPARVPPAGPVPADIDPTAPLDDLPGLDLAWPDLADRSDEPVAPAGGAAIDVATPRRYTVRLLGLEAIDASRVRERFDALSILKRSDGDPAIPAQIDRRAREDAELLVELLRAEGYYDARARPAVAAAGERLVVTLRANPGQVYRLTAVDLGTIDAAGAAAPQLRGAVGVAADAPASADAIVAGQAAVTERLGREGFPFAQVGEPELTVDRDSRTASLILPVDPGARATFGEIRAAPNRVFGARHIGTIARFDPGDQYDAADITDLRRALINTGLVSSATIETVPGRQPGTVDVQVALEPAPPRTIAGELGYGTGEGARAAISWQHRNLFPPEGALTLRGVLGTQEQLASVAFRRNNWRRRDQVLTAQVSAANISRDAFDARTIGVSGGLERQSNIIFQKAWTWSVGAELLLSDERDTLFATGEDRRRTFFIAALPGSLYYDGTDDLLNPSRGFRLGGRLSPELSLQGAAFGYARVQLDASGYLPVGERVVLAARTRLGTIAGAAREDIAPSRRFYAGGGGSVRGYSFQAIGPRDPNNDPVGGRSLTELAVEARVRFGDFGVVPFVDAGNISTSSFPRFDNLRVGAGVGVRYYSNFGPIRVDVGTPINPAPGDPRVAVYVSLGQAF